MATSVTDLYPARASTAQQSGAAPALKPRFGWLRRSACIGWYLAIAIAAVADTMTTGLPAAGLAAVFVACSALALLWPTGFTVERAMIRCLLMGVIGLLVGVAVCVAAPAGSFAQAEFLTFGAMSMLFGVLGAFPLALASALR